jgi:hypothetical protein
MQLFTADATIFSNVFQFFSPINGLNRRIHVPKIWLINQLYIKLGPLQLVNWLQLLMKNQFYCCTASLGGCSHLSNKRGVSLIVFLRFCPPPPLTNSIYLRLLISYKISPSSWILYSDFTTFVPPSGFYFIPSSWVILFVKYLEMDENC